MLFGRICANFVLCHVKGLDKSQTRFLRQDDIVDVTQFGSTVRVGELLSVFDFRLRLLLIVGFVVEDVDSTVGTHHGDFSRRVGEVDVRARVFAAHDDVGTTIGFAGDKRDFRNSGFDVSVNDFGSVADDSVVLLCLAREESWNVNERYDRNVEAVAEANESRRLVRSVNVKHTGLVGWLVRHDADGLAGEVRIADDDVLRKVRHDFEEVVVVNYRLDEFLYVVRFVWIVRNDVVEGFVDVVHLSRSNGSRSVLDVVGREEGDQFTYHHECFFFVVANEVGHTRDISMGHGSTEFLLGDDFVGDGLDYVRTGDKHIGGVLDHEDEVGQCGRVARSTSARSHDD